jgi:hypothetical protein
VISVPSGTTTCTLYHRTSKYLLQYLLLLLLILLLLLLLPLVQYLLRSIITTTYYYYYLPDKRQARSMPYKILHCSHGNIMLYNVCKRNHHPVYALALESSIMIGKNIMMSLEKDVKKINSNNESNCCSNDSPTTRTTTTYYY